MREIILFFFGLALLFIPNSLYAQKTGAYIGKLDLYTVTMLHPAMIWYSPEKKGFKVTRTDVDKKRITQLNEIRAKELNELHYKMNAINSRIKKENKDYDTNVAFMSRKYFDKQANVGTATYELNKKRFKKQTEESLAIHQVKINQLYGELAKIEEKINNLDEDTEFGYSNSVETEKRIKDIIKEIKIYSKRIADQKGINIVLNSGYKKLLPPKTDRNNTSSFSDHDAFGTVFTLAFPNSLSNDEGAVKGYYNSIESKTKIWLNNGKSLFNNNLDAMVNDDIIVGGVDLTTDVLYALYKAYKLDANITNAVIQAVKNFSQ